MSSKKEIDNISFDMPKNQSNVIKVIGVGGGGSVGWEGRGGGKEGRARGSRYH